MASDELENEGVTVTSDNQEIDAFTLMTGDELITAAEEEQIALDNAIKTATPPSKKTSVTGSVRIRQGRKRSEIWKHFMKVNHNLAVQCFYCGQTLSFAAGSLSNLLRHLRTKHPRIAATFKYNNGSKVFKKRSALPQTEETNPTVVEVFQAPVLRESSPFIDPVTVVVNSDGGEINSAENSADPLKEIRINKAKVKHEGSKEGGSSFMNDHSYVDKPQLVVEELFGVYIQSELARFKSELLLRKCKREILRVLMKYQEIEDEEY